MQIQTHMGLRKDIGSSHFTINILVTINILHLIHQVEKDQVKKKPGLCNQYRVTFLILKFITTSAILNVLFIKVLKWSFNTTICSDGKKNDGYPTMDLFKLAEMMLSRHTKLVCRMILSFWAVVWFYDLFIPCICIWESSLNYT